jgi:hypothetical protein
VRERTEVKDGCKLVNNDAREVNQVGRRQYRNFELCDYLYGLTSANCDGVIYFLW